jgi:hypothetical protein
MGMGDLHRYTTVPWYYSILTFPRTAKADVFEYCVKSAGQLRAVQHFASARSRSYLLLRDGALRLPVPRLLSGSLSTLLCSLILSGHATRMEIKPLLGMAMCQHRAQRTSDARSASGWLAEQRAGTEAREDPKSFYIEV